MTRPNVLFIMTDQQRFDTIAALGNSNIHTPNMDRLVGRGVNFARAYSTCPVCMPARYTIHTGCEPPRTGSYDNGPLDLAAGQPASMEARCGPYLARTMAARGYRTFGIGKFHTAPWNEDLGFGVHLHSEEMWGGPRQRSGDGFAGWIEREHPEFAFIEQLMGERTEMYYMPQVSPLPAELTVERWAADRAVEQIGAADGRPFFGFVSFVGPHPPLAPPIPFNRLYDPDGMADPVLGDLAVDHMDEQIPWMNYAVWAEDIAPPLARCLKARYYGEITYIDDCLGRILDAVEARPDADNTLICFFCDHGDMLGDHHAWQKECFFEASCRVPMLLSWPAQLPTGRTCDELVCLADLFGAATAAGGAGEFRDGLDLLGLLRGRSSGRELLVGCYGRPGTPTFKVMVRDRDWKYVFMANGGREQLFNLDDDPRELVQRLADRADVAAGLRQSATAGLRASNIERALDGDRLRAFPFAPRPLRRIYQMDRSRGQPGRFPAHPADVLNRLER